VCGWVWGEGGGVNSKRFYERPYFWLGNEHFTIFWGLSLIPKPHHIQLDLKNEKCDCVVRAEYQAKVRK